MSTKAKARNLVAQVRELGTELTAAVEENRRAQRQKQQELIAAQGARIPRADAEQRIRRLRESLAARFLRDEIAFRTSPVFMPGGASQVIHAIAEPTFHGLEHVPSGDWVLGLIAAGAPETFDAMIARVLDTCPTYGEPGTSAQTRAAQIAALEKEIERLENEEEELIATAAEAGVEIPKSAEHKMRAQRRAQRERAEAEMQRVNAEIARRSGPPREGYLTIEGGLQRVRK